MSENAESDEPATSESTAGPDAAPAPVGVVLGSMDAGPLEFWVGVEAGQLLQLDDLVVVEVALPRPVAAEGAGAAGGVRVGGDDATAAPGRAESVSFYGIVDLVRKRYEGAQFDTDAFRAAEGLLPVEVSYAAHVQVTRVDPEIFVPPSPGTPVRVVQGEDFQRALFIDQMEKRVAIGLTRAGEAVFANLEFLDGTRGAHASISGISGVATKTSYATFLLYALFHSDALGADAPNSRALVFNVKGEDLLWLDKPNARLGPGAAAAYASLGLPAGPFDSVGFYAPARRHGEAVTPDVGGRHEGVRPYAWTMREFARERLLSFAFADAGDARSQLSFLITRVETALERAAREGDPNDPGIELGGRAVRTFRDLCDALDGEVLDAIARNAAPGTLDAFRRRLFAAGQHMGHLVRGDRETRGRGVDWQAHQVTVVDIHTLHETAQMFVVGVVLKRMMRDKELQGTARPLVFLLLDELNKYAPRSGWSPIREVLLDIAERGRSLGVCLFGAQQTASQVERRVVANAALKAVGRLDAAEAERGEYGFLTKVARQRATLLSPGSMIVTQPEVPTPVLLQFPFPAWATRQSEVDPVGKGGGAAGTGEDPFARS